MFDSVTILKTALIKLRNFLYQAKTLHTMGHYDKDSAEDNFLLYHVRTGCYSIIQANSE